MPVNTLPERPEFLELLKDIIEEPAVLDAFVPLLPPAPPPSPPSSPLLNGLCLQARTPLSHEVPA